MYKERVASCGTRIAEALRIRDMKQSDLCKRANVPKSSLSLYLSGAYEPKQERIFDMANALCVDEAWLMGYDVPMEKNADKKSPRDTTITEGEKTILSAYRALPDATQEKLTRLLLKFRALDEKDQAHFLDVLGLMLSRNQ